MSFYLSHGILLFTVGIIGGMIGAIAGGGGLLITPALLFIGLSPVQAIATQNLYAVPMLLSATWKFWKQGHIPVAKVVPILPVLLAFSLLGAISVSRLPAEFLKILVPVLLIGLAIWVFTNPSLDSCARKQRFSFAQFLWLAIPPLAFYDGFFGACSTTFYTIACIALLGMTTLQATAITKPISATSSCGALLWFIFNGDVSWTYGTMLALGGVIGAQIGAGLALKHGAKLIRLALLATTSLVSLKLLANQIAAFHLL